MISMYYNHDFEAHKNLSHKQLWLTVYYFMDYAVSYNGSLKTDYKQSQNEYGTYR